MLYKLCALFSNKDTKPENHLVTVTTLAPGKYE